MTSKEIKRLIAVVLVAIAGAIGGVKLVEEDGTQTCPQCGTPCTPAETMAQ
jgi:hypothetical protein